MSLKRSNSSIPDEEPDPEFLEGRRRRDADGYMDAVPRSGVGVRAVALLDIEMRTALSSLIAISAIPSALRDYAPSRDHDAAAFYAEMQRTGTIESIFPTPPTVDVHASKIGRPLWAPKVDSIEMLSFKSPYRVQYAQIRASYESHTRNSVAQAMHWRHADGPRPTIIVVHGFTGSPFWFNSNFFSLPWFYRHGCDVLLAVLPFHGKRNDRWGAYSGSGLFGGGVAYLNEAMFQSICDLRVMVDYLERSGVDHVGITGLSLGGYLTALMADVEPRLHVAIPNSAVTHFPSLLDSWFPAGYLAKAGLRLSRHDDVTLSEAMSVHSPLSFPARLPRDRLFIIGGLADRLAPPDQSARLWEHWGEPKIHWFPGSHILHVGRASYLREVGHFLRDTGFSPG